VHQLKKKEHANINKKSKPKQKTGNKYNANRKHITGNIRNITKKKTTMESNTGKTENEQAQTKHLRNVQKKKNNNWKQSVFWSLFASLVRFW